MRDFGADDVWRACRPLQDLGPEVHARLAEVTQSRRWDDGALLFQRGDQGDYLMVIRSGQLRLSLTTPQGQELTLHHAGPGDLVGELAVVGDQPRSADCTAMGPVTAQVLTRDGFMGVAKDHPDLLLAMLRHLAGLMRITNDRLESVALYRLEARLARFLLGEVARQHGVGSLQDAPAQATIELPMGQGDLALVLGASRPKVNRALHKLAEVGAIVRNGQELQCDIDALANLAEPS
ncbi:Crp/Fnr family transcriptional regulator [Flavimaricola marinus]|uniref:cAMP receptor protein n=1 Tax=Flavimaricola marinus TaxID=1819565 RepID=A0A238L8G4_9RHOB|nr:Crp/Fnr family transcriptional regulator [Flavimaricola marinus]SMY05979.1 cAMP receptor protein [Flavimaricola marinus]